MRGKRQGTLQSREGTATLDYEPYIGDLWTARFISLPVFGIRLASIKIWTQFLIMDSLAA